MGDSITHEECINKQTELLTFNVVKAAITDNYALFKQYESQIASLSEDDAIELLRYINMSFNFSAFDDDICCTSKLPAAKKHIMVSIYQHLAKYGLRVDPLVFASHAQIVCLCFAILTGNTTTLSWIYDNTFSVDKDAYFIHMLTHEHPNSSTVAWYAENISSNISDYDEVKKYAKEVGEYCLVQNLKFVMK